MKQQIECYAARIAMRIHSVGAQVDPEILQLPGGSVIATLMWLYATSATVFRKH